MQVFTIGAVMLAAGFSFDASTPSPDAPPPEPNPNPRYVLDHRAARIDGAPEDLGRYEGQVVLIVNTASRCGLTPQYEGLEKLYRTYKDEGFVVLGFPANDFNAQEPGSNEEILAFCTGRFDVTFPMFEKVSVKGEQACPLYRDLTGQPEPAGGEPSWNFTKYLVNRRGEAVHRFDPRTPPDDEKLVAKIKELLAEDRPQESGRPAN